MSSTLDGRTLAEPDGAATATNDRDAVKSAGDWEVDDA
jgi:hypothetical protein